MDTEPAKIIAALGQIEDQLATLEDQLANAAGDVKHGDKFVEYFEASLYTTIDDAENTTERKVLARAAAADQKEVLTYLKAVREHAKLATQVEILDIRRSIGQSMLKAQQPAQYPQHGQAAHGQSGT